MRYGLKEIKDLDDWALTIAYEKCGQADKQRQKASEHSKFNKDGWDSGGIKKKLDFPPVNDQFTAMKNEITAEMKKRNLL